MIRNEWQCGCCRSGRSEKRGSSSLPIHSAFQGSCKAGLKICALGTAALEAYHGYSEYA